MTQFALTLTIGVGCLLIPLFFLFRAVGATPKHNFACASCDADVPAGNARCPQCGAPQVDQDVSL